MFTGSIQERIDQTRDDFVGLVWPIMHKKIGGGDLLSIEDARNTHHHLWSYLDTYSGIDHIQICHERRGSRGLSTRMQRLELRPYFETFTIRYRKQSGNETEYGKRLREIDSGWFYPELHIQAYLQGERVTAVGIARMKDLIHVIQYGERGDRNRPCDWYLDITSQQWGQHDATEFAVIPIRSLDKFGKRKFWCAF